MRVSYCSCHMLSMKIQIIGKVISCTLGRPGLWKSALSGGCKKLSLAAFGLYLGITAEGLMQRNRDISGDGSSFPGGNRLNVCSGYPGADKAEDLSYYCIEFCGNFLNSDLFFSLSSEDHHLISCSGFRYVC